MSMTKTQQNYAISKAKEIIFKKKDLIKKEHGWPATRLTNNEKHNLIVTGKVKLLSKKKMPSKAGYRLDVSDYFDFTPFEKDSGMSKKGERLLSELDKALEEVEEKIMLGDSKEAISLLENLRAL